MDVREWTPWLTFRLDDVLHHRRVTFTELSEKIGITLANLSILKTGKARGIDFSTFESICQALHCSLGDILEFVAAAGADDKEAHDHVA